MMSEYLGEPTMTKAKARARAKAKATQKAIKRKANADQGAPKVRPGHFDPAASSISSPRGTNAKNFGRGNRGAARSR